MKPILKLIILHVSLTGGVIVAGQDNVYTKLCNDIETINEETDQKLREAETEIAKLRAECICAFNKDVDARLKVIQKKIASMRDGCYCPAPISRPTPDCPEGWSLFQGICYSFYNRQLTWDKAQERCETFGGSLASADTEEINNFLVDLAFEMRNDEYKIPFGPWIGGKMIGGSWVWTKTDKPLVYENWEPNHYEFTDDECIYFYRYDTLPLQWRNTKCHTPLQSICEKPVSI